MNMTQAPRLQLLLTYTPHEPPSTAGMLEHAQSAPVRPPGDDYERMIADLFEVDLVLPAQYAHVTTDRAMPERLLACAVVRQAHAELVGAARGRLIEGMSLMELRELLADVEHGVLAPWFERAGLDEDVMNEQFRALARACMVCLTPSARRARVKHTLTHTQREAQS